MNGSSRNNLLGEITTCEQKSESQTKIDTLIKCIERLSITVERSSFSNLGEVSSEGHSGSFSSRPAQLGSIAAEPTGKADMNYVSSEY